MSSPVTSTAHRASSACLHPADRQVTLFSARDYVTGDLFRIQRCHDCGLARTFPRPAVDELSRYYPAGYHGRGGRYPRPLQLVLDLIYARRARRLEQICGGRPGRVLDIGCGPGRLLSQLRQRGWQVMGTELSDESARFARETLGLNVLTAPGALDALPAGSFDLIVLWHVLEHVADPGAQIQEVERLLRPGGIALFAVPNLGSLEARWAGPRWFHLDVPRHLNHFDLPVLRRLLEANGLNVASVRYFTPEYDFFSAMQTGLNMFGIRQNLLYNLLRSAHSRMFSSAEPAGRAETLVSLALAPLLFALSLISAPAAAAFRRGATVTVYARKSAAGANSHGSEQQAG
jgi:SAM-dependent methyltransferase